MIRTVLFSAIIVQLITSRGSIYFDQRVGEASRRDRV